MIVGVEVFLRKLGRFFSPEEWLARLLRLPSPAQSGIEPGFVLVQIDGLSHSQFERAIRDGNMPFLARLMKHEAYVNRRHYSGLPSSTPAVQGALFYGVTTAVPAFSYRDSGSGQIFNMFLPRCAQSVEKRLVEQGGQPLMAGGSAYGDIYTGGAAEAHFCAAAIGWGSLLNAIRNPFMLPITLLLNFHVLVRTVVLMGVELVIALSDCFGNPSRSLLRELGYIPLRVAVCVVLRESIAAGARVDIVRGLPSIHVNFAGYDEQAHQRGPRSSFAHWSLRGIDNAIAGLWKTAQRSHRRDYEVFIYSDHGQEETRPYASLHGTSIGEAVNRVFREKIASGAWRSDASRTMPHSRADTLRNKPPPEWQAAAPPVPDSDASRRIIVAAMGPVGHIYPPEPLSAEEMEHFAPQLVESAHVPIVMVPGATGQAWVWNSRGRFELPAQADQVLDPAHPFLGAVTRDLVALCHHPDSGQFIILGWSAGAPITFVGEHGSHAGPGPEETCGFALLPVDTMPRAFGNTISTLDLREAALHALEHGHDRSAATRAGTPERASVLRVMTYNVHGCLGRDGKISPGRIARIIARHQPDIACLQELDVLGQSHQAEIIARKLEMTFQYHSAVNLSKGLHGNAIFSRHPMRLVASRSLPRLARNRLFEPRGALWAEIDLAGQKVQVINTHLSLSGLERLQQVEALLGPDWLASADCSDPVVLCGDFNALPGSRIGRKLGQRFRNVQTELAGHDLLHTLPSFFPVGPVDHVFVGAGINILNITVPRTDIERMASDHLPLVVELELEASPPEAGRLAGAG